DGDARGGAALSVREAISKPIKFISTGEKLDALEAFYPDRMASRILGMGDVLTLVEKAQASIDEKEAEKVAKNMLAGEFTLEMFVSAQRMMKKLGSLGDIMKMMGLGGMLGISSEQQDMIASHGEAMFQLYETAINSMTPTERNRPEIINMSRRRRIARGAGLKENEVGQMLNEFEQMRAMFQQFKQLGALGGLGKVPGMPFGMPGSLPGTKKLKMPSAPPPGFPFKGPGGGYYRKKGKRF
ncbi:MAG: signal recognition particle protein, partial [Candidatus Melainabacteria bacterium]|nr:signal recognition particle protein [Candidatus Melainabacteria bacterium]